VIRRAQQKPGDGWSHWSVRKLAEELGVSKSTVHRILAQAKPQPHRLERYMTSNDPEFEQKAADIIGLYLDPPQHAAVFCVDEKTAIQAGPIPIRNVELSLSESLGRATSSCGVGNFTAGKFSWL
jgi:hypothetical protein